MKAVVLYFHVVLFVMLYKVVQTLKSAGKPYYVTIQIKAIEQYVHVVLFVMLYKVVLTFKSAYETLAWDYSKKSKIVNVFLCR